MTLEISKPFALAATMLLLSAVLSAQDDEIIELEPLTVRGDLLQSSIEEMPSSVSIIRASDASASGSAHFENLLGQLPNLNYAGGTSRPRFFQIRGIGENSQFGNEIPASSVGFIVDGIDLTGIGGIAGLFDVARVEVLRGPQAAAFGANALAGMVIIETTEPSATRSGLVESSVGEFGLYSFGAALGGPLKTNSEGSLSYRISLQQYHDDGYRENRFLNRDDTNERDERTARLKLNWKPLSRLQFDLNVLYFDFENGYDAWSLDNDSFITTTDEPGEDNQETLAIGMRATLHLNDAIDLTYKASTSASDLKYSYDWDWSNPEALMALYGPEVYWGTDITDRERTVYSHDLRFASPAGQDGDTPATAWAAGLYYRDFEEEQSYFGVDSLYATETAALYGQLRHPLGAALSLTVAGRIEDVSIDYSDTLGTSLGSSTQPWGGKIALEYRQSDRSSLYASIDRGFKSGGVNLDDDVPGEYRVYGTETLWNVEIGWRGVLLEDRLWMQATAFHMRREDIQVDTSIQLGDGNTFALYKDNAASGSNTGLELETTWSINQQFKAFASVGLLDTKFDDYRYVDPSDGESLIVLDGHEQAYAPRFNYAVGTSFETESGLFASITLEGKDAYFFDVANNQKLGGYSLLHLNLGYDNGIWRITLWGNNILDEKYETRGFFFGNEPPYYDAPKKWVSHGSPRMLGLSVRRSF